MLKKLAVLVLKKHKDPYVKINVALGLIGQNIEVKRCSDVIYGALTKNQELWMMDNSKNPLFSTLIPSRIRHVDQIPNYPSSVDQITRLNLLSLLAIIEDGRAIDAIKQFLNKKEFQVSGFAAAVLLQEGDENCLKLVKKLLNDEDQTIKIQAALILAMLAKDDSVVNILYDAYFISKRDEKMRILEALGYLGSIKSAPFLIDRLEEQSQVLRVISAASLIQCLNK